MPRRPGEVRTTAHRPRRCLIHPVAMEKQKHKLSREKNEGYGEGQVTFRAGLSRTPGQAEERPAKGWELGRKGDACIELEKYLQENPETIIAFVYFRTNKKTKAKTGRSKQMNETTH